MTSHVKHIIWAVALLVGVITCFVVRAKVEAYKADRLAASNEKIAQNQLDIAKLQSTSQAVQGAITSRDLQNEQDIAALKAKAAQALTPAQAQALVLQMLSGLKVTAGVDAQGNPTSTVSTADLAAALNKASLTNQICDKNLGTCAADKQGLQSVIANDAQIKAKDDDTIKRQGSEIVELTKNQVPRWTLMAGVGKTQGTTFQSSSSYQPLIGVDYRLTQRFGIFGLAQNKAGAVGLSWRFGSIK